MEELSLERWKRVRAWWDWEEEGKINFVNILPEEVEWANLKFDLDHIRYYREDRFG